MMLRNPFSSNPFSSPAPVAGVIAPAAAALLVAMSVVTIVVALPSLWPSRVPPAMLTSGGKFAARIPDLPLVETGLPAAAARNPALPIMTHPSELYAMGFASARSAWSMTTSAGGSLMSHLLPQ